MVEGDKRTPGVAGAPDSSKTRCYVVDEDSDVALRVARALRNRKRRVAYRAPSRVLCNDSRMRLDVCRARRLVEELRHADRAADALEVPACAQRRRNGHELDRVAAST